MEINTTIVVGSANIYGYESLDKRILNLIRALPDEIKQAMIVEEEGTLALAVKKCPWKTHDLQNSGHLGEYQISGSEVTIPIIFGVDLTYAVYVHEDLLANHPNGGEAKFLENAVMERLEGKLDRVRDQIHLDRII